MPTVRLSFSPAPAHVRTARLVAVAVARRAGVADELLEEIRLAIGEACSRAVALHRSQGTDSLIDMAMNNGDRFTVRVTDRVSDSPATTDPAAFLGEAPAAAEVPESLAEEAVAARMGLTLLAGLVDDLQVNTLADGLGTEVSMSWPVTRKPTDA
ncbi:ATP-binding protein [Planosporangium flavigriseum]|uniref:Anti-sigma regulatory factor n=1 Tax=Planosporangium flavigriseum TaxID=373681 RepID=A0A8J3PNC8_9ACTN|nr:ATP-binding protein [Planosporangium flavigriseum]NJC64290.1 ATP-binding protein [Planosporangium flavigriseum]GIG73811.1 anti-sigma regulatory factor [Planosporangium flavigriseum]